MTTPERIARFVLERERRREARRQELVQAARAEAGRLARILRDQLGAHRVILFGSVATGSPSDDPDIDLAVEGLEGRLTEAHADLMETSRFAVDLVALERARAPLRQRILEDGVELP